MTDASEALVIPDVPDAIVAYRSWNLSSDGGLYGARGQLWPPRKPMIAICLRGCDDCPCPPSEAGITHDNHGCGIYAERAEPRDIADSHESVVWGEVRLFGKVYEYDKGWRAEKAEIACIYDTGDHCSRVAEVYGVDLIPAPAESIDDIVARLQQKADTRPTLHRSGYLSLNTASSPVPTLLLSGRTINSATATTAPAASPAGSPDPLGFRWVDVKFDDGYSIRRNRDGHRLADLTWQVLDPTGEVVAQSRRKTWSYKEDGPWLSTTDYVHNKKQKPDGPAYQAALRALNRHRERQKPIKKLRVAIVAYWFAYLAYVGWRAAATGNYVLYGVCAALAVAFIAFNWRRRRG